MRLWFYAFFLFSFVKMFQVSILRFQVSSFAKTYGLIFVKVKNLDKDRRITLLMKTKTSILAPMGVISFFLLL
ncbi:hypothetical protein HYN86_18500 [Flavobacterium fluviale]|uniref:Uncharacterized protein n=1 Tax=Flavobacterium fluviale TaxID=2249356 RepID=A0A344LX32_9FLAO|nr:hypothetical protein HYN86_18500 [Flavobacterium fluviale]